MTKAYQAIAAKIAAMRNCNANGNDDWFARHAAAIDSIVRDSFPSGSGFDAGTEFDACQHVDDKRDRLEFTTAFHHMNDAGMYDGWTYHKVIVTPDLASGFNLRVTGRDRNGIKDYIVDTFHAALNSDVGA